jgi:hypothetical protein
LDGGAVGGHSVLEDLLHQLMKIDMRPVPHPFRTGVVAGLALFVGSFYAGMAWYLSGILINGRRGR